MKINHQENFFATFAYESMKTNESCPRNLTKATSYIPIAGFVIPAVVAVIALANSKSADDRAFSLAVAGRALISLVCPFVLPIIDIIATIWRACINHKQKKLSKY